MFGKMQMLFAPDTGLIGGCPAAPSFDPLDPQTAADPYPHLVALRRDRPVFEMAQYGMWCLTRRDDILEVLRDPELYSVAPYASVTEVPAAIRSEVGVDYVPPITLDQILTTDPPRHTRLRKAFQPAFTPKAIGRYEGVVRATVDELIDGFVGEGRTDFVDAFARPLPLTVIGTIIGLPPDRRGEFRGYIEAVMRAQLSAGLPEEELVGHWRTILGFDGYFREFLDDRRAHPQDDLASAVLHAPAEASDEALSDRALRSSLIGLAIAGGDTIAILLTHIMHLLLSEPARWQSLQRDRAQIPGVVEEVLRLNGPVVALLRQTTAAVQVGGVDIPQGAVLYLHIGSANHDEATFDEPETFLLGRQGLTKHLAFGTLTHFCLGAPLARLQARVALERLLVRLPSPRLANPDQPLEYVPNFLFPQVQHLQLRWNTTT